MKQLKPILIAIICSIIFTQTVCAERHVMTFKESVRAGQVDAPRLRLPKKAKRLSSNRATIEVTFSEETPDSIRTAFNVAKGIWESKLPALYPIRIDVSFEPLEPETAALAEVSYVGVDDMAHANLPGGCPSALSPQIGGEPFTGDDSADGVIVMNSDVKWNCNFNDVPAEGYNVTTTALREIAICLGFGSSLGQWEPGEDKLSYFSPSPTYFDRLLQDGTHYLTELDRYPNKMMSFATSGKVFVETEDSKYKLYSPKVFETYTSLVYLEEPSLMSIGIGEGSVCLNVDDVTVDILRTVGWNIPVSGRDIKCLDIGSDGIGSSYAPHTFSLVDGVGTVSSYSWSFHLKQPNGEYVKIKTGRNAEFIIDKISSPSNYYINENGDMEGMIACEYVISGKKYSANPFYVSLELKPLILSVENLKTHRSGLSFNFYATMSVNYVGADNLTVMLEEDNNVTVRVQEYEEPFIAHVKTDLLTILDYTWITLSASNKYGTTTETIEYAPFEAITYDRVHGDPIIFERRLDNYDVELINLSGKTVFRGIEKEIGNAGLSHGVYVKIHRDKDGLIIKNKKIVL